MDKSLIDPEWTKALDRAKIQLMRVPNTLFYTTILFSLKQIWDENIETAAVDGIHLFINPEFFIDLTDHQRMGVLVHEVLHPALGHITRKGDRDHILWNKAGDYVINLAMSKVSGYGLPSWVLYDERFENMNTEQVYDILYQENPHDKDIPGGGDIIQPPDKVANDNMSKDIADIVQKAAIQAKANGQTPGDLPGDVDIAIDEAINPKLPWEVTLQNYFSNFAKDDYSWKRPNRRFPDFYMPSAFSEAICDIASAVDASCSVRDHEFNHFIGEHAEIQYRLKPEKMTVITFDTKIREVQEITQNTNILTDLKFTGRGGTKIQPVLEWAQENNPTVLLVFTDGEFNWPDEQYWPDCPVLWLIHGDTQFTAPFGEVIHYDI